jgi:uncharacterized protein (TIGR03437 family)
MAHLEAVTAFVLLTSCAALGQSAYSLNVNPTTIVAGGQPFSLAVTFGGNSTTVPTPKDTWVVRWNGLPRPTHFSRNTTSAQVQADISASDIATPGFAEISIQDSKTGVVYPVTAWFLVTVDVNVTDFVYDGLRNRFYVTVPTGGTRPNAPAETVVAIDADTGEVGPSIDVGAKPTLLALSDDSRYLYVYLSGSSAISRVSLSTFTSDLQFPLAGSAQTALAMAVRPGVSATLAVSQTGTSANSGRIVLYDDGKSSPQSSADLLAAKFAFLDANTIVTGGYVTPMNILNISAAGVAASSSIPGTVGQEMPLATADGLVYASNGNVYDARSPQFIGRTDLAGFATFLPGRSRLLVLALTNSGSTVQLAAFDQTTLLPLGRFQVNGSYTSFGYQSPRLIAWGRDGVAFVVAQRLLIGHTPLAGPAPAWTAAGALSAATLAPSSVAPGEVMVVFGSDLGPDVGRSMELSAPRKVSTILGGAEVWFDGLPGTMLYADAGQLRVVAPFGLAGRDSTKVQLWNGGIPSAAIPLQVVPVAPGIFTQDGSGRGQGMILNADGNLNSPDQPATAGATATLFGSGGGVTSPAGEDGVLTSDPLSLAASVRVFLDGDSVPVLYAGSAPGQVAGVIKVDFQIPADYRASDSVSVQVEIGGVVSPAGVSMAVH